MPFPAGGALRSGRQGLLATLRQGFLLDDLGRTGVRSCWYAGCMSSELQSRRKPDFGMLARWQNFAEAVATRDESLADSLVINYATLLTPVVDRTIELLGADLAAELVDIDGRITSVADEQRGSISATVALMSTGDVRDVVERLIRIAFALSVMSDDLGD